MRILHSLGSGNPLSRTAAVLGAGPRFLNGTLLRNETSEANDRYGFRVAVGDLFGSTKTEEVVASSPFETVGSISSGVVEVHTMDITGAVTVLHSDSPCDRGVCSNGQRFGDSLAVANVNGDLRPDLIVGNRATVAGNLQAGTVTVFGAVPPLFGSYLDPFLLHQDAPAAASGTRAALRPLRRFARDR